MATQDRIDSKYSDAATASGREWLNRKMTGGPNNYFPASHFPVNDDRDPNADRAGTRVRDAAGN